MSVANRRLPTTTAVSAKFGCPRYVFENLDSNILLDTSCLSLLLISRKNHFIVRTVACAESVALIRFATAMTVRCVFRTLFLVNHTNAYVTNTRATALFAWKICLPVVVPWRTCPVDIPFTLNVCRITFARIIAVPCAKRLR